MTSAKVRKLKARHEKERAAELEALNVFNNIDDFGEVWEVWEPVIDRRSRYIFMPDTYDADDTYGEMSEVFVKCWQVFDETGVTPLSGFYWTSWGRRRVSIWRYVKQQKRDAFTRLIGDISELEAVGPLILGQPAIIEEPFAEELKAVWVMLSQGYTRKEVMEELGMTRARLDSIIRLWRRPDVKQLLTDVA